MAISGPIVVTGATSGIGKACALRLDALGHEVIATYLREEEGRALAGEASSRLKTIHADLREQSTIRDAGAAISEAVDGRGLAGLVNNAGVNMPGPLEFLPLASLREQLEINVLGQVAMTQECLPAIRRGHGRIVFIGSIDGKAVTPFQGAYGASKHAIEALADVFRMELKPWGIAVSLVEPGDIATPLWRKTLARADDALKGLPETAHEYYGSTMAAARATAEKMEAAAAPPEIVVKAVLHALTARRPKTRYLVGKDAKMRLAMEWLPTRMVDALIMRTIRKGG